MWCELPRNAIWKYNTIFGEATKKYYINLFVAHNHFYCIQIILRGYNLHSELIFQYDIVAFFYLCMYSV